MAVELANSGAKYLATISRSGYDDEVSQRIIHQIQCLGAHIDLLKVDVTRIEDVRKAFNNTIFPIGGIIQGAMVLRVRCRPSSYREQGIPNKARIIPLPL